MKSSTPLEHSVQSRLLAHARALGADPNLILARYANERFLYRVSQSRHADRFILKGAMLLGVVGRNDPPDATSICSASAICPTTQSPPLFAK